MTSNQLTYKVKRIKEVSVFFIDLVYLIIKYLISFSNVLIFVSIYYVVCNRLDAVLVFHSYMYSC